MAPQHGGCRKQRICGTEYAGDRRKVVKVQCGSNPQAGTNEQQCIALLRAKPLQRQLSGKQGNCRRYDNAEGVESLTGCRKGTDAQGKHCCQESESRSVGSGAHRVSL